MAVVFHMRSYFSDGLDLELRSQRLGTQRSSSEKPSKAELLRFNSGDRCKRNSLAIWPDRAFLPLELLRPELVVKVENF